MIPPASVLRRVRSAVVATALAVGSLAACGSPPEAPIDEATFVAAWVDLRVAAVDQPGGELTDARRSEILSRHGVTADDLVAFAEVHGGDVVFMNRVWDEIERRMESAGRTPDSSAAPTPEA